MIVGGIAAAAVVGLAVAVPNDLFNSSPRHPSLRGLAGDVRVLDGETLAIGTEVLRLAGVRAPERGRICQDAAGRDYDCGTAAAEALARLIGGREVECHVQGRDSHGRPRGVCRAGGADLNASLVADGWVLAGAGSPSLVPLEASARQGRRGLWAAAETDAARRGY